MQWDLKVWPNKNGQSSKKKADVTVIIDGLMEVKGFSLIDTARGWWLAPPARQYQDKDGNNKNYNYVWFLDADRESGTPSELAEDMTRRAVELLQEGKQQNSRAGAAAARGSQGGSKGGSGGQSGRPSGRPSGQTQAPRGRAPAARQNPAGPPPSDDFDDEIPF